MFPTKTSGGFHGHRATPSDHPFLDGLAPHSWNPPVDVTVLHRPIVRELLSFSRVLCLPQSNHSDILRYIQIYSDHSALQKLAFPPSSNTRNSSFCQIFPYLRFQHHKSTQKKHRNPPRFPVAFPFFVTPQGGHAPTRASQPGVHQRFDPSASPGGWGARGRWDFQMGYGEPMMGLIWQYLFWLVVWTPLKNISQLGWLFPIYGKIKKCSKPPTSCWISVEWTVEWIRLELWRTNISWNMCGGKYLECSGNYVEWKKLEDWAVGKFLIVRVVPRYRCCLCGLWCL